MVSTFGWLDTDPEERRRMLAVVDLSKEKRTVDDLGFGPIRDAFADILFPGTTTIHTRLKYVLFVPWLLRQAAKGRGTAAEMSERLTDLQVDLIDALTAGGEVHNVIGSDSRRKLQRTPAGIYAGAMSTWGIATGNPWSSAYFRRQVDRQRLSAQAITTTDDPESRAPTIGDGLDPNLPEPPQNLLTSTDFGLSAEQREYLTYRITASVPDSLLGWLLKHPPGNLSDAGAPWDLDDIAGVPTQLRELIDHARRFSTIAHGATLTYNYHLSELSRERQNAGDHEDRSFGVCDEALAAWEGHADGELLRPWTHREWDTLSNHGHRIRTPTQQFVGEWLALLNSDPRSPLRGPDARRIVEDRERRIKGGLARFSNRSALDRWNGTVPAGSLTFRWPVAQRHLRDLVREVS